jgi:hypothetical protein
MTDAQKVLRDTGRRALITFGYAGPEDDEWLPMAVTSREMLQVERQVKGFTANGFFKDVSITGLYRILFVVLRMRGGRELPPDFEAFVDTFDVKFGDPTRTDDGDDEDESESEVDPTQPAA